MMNMFYFDEINRNLEKLNNAAQSMPYKQATETLQAIGHIRSLVESTYSVSQHFNGIWDEVIEKTCGPKFVDSWQNAPNSDKYTDLDRWGAVYELARRQILRDLGVSQDAPRRI